MDTDSLGPAVALARRLAGAAGAFKIGSQLFTAEGPHAVDQLAKLGSGIFLDLKFHDIPNTVAGAVRAAADLPQVRILTIHALGGLQMMKAAKEASRARRRSPAILAVTILTSHDASTLQQVGISGTPGTRALELAKLAKEAGVDGVVASAHEVADIRKACGPKFLIIVPGVRPANAALNDQSRIATPAEAIRAGADYLVVGRPITAATNPRESALAIAKEIAQASSKPRA